MRMAERTLCLITSPHVEKSDRFDAFLDGELVVTSRQPRLDGARELLRRGYSPDALMTTRAEGRDYDSFIPAPIGEVAKWTVYEEDKKGLRRRLWQPHPNAVSRGAVEGRTRNSPLQGVQAPETEDDAVEPDRWGVTARTDAA